MNLASHEHNYRVAKKSDVRLHKKDLIRCRDIFSLVSVHGRAVLAIARR